MEMCQLNTTKEIHEIETTIREMNRCWTEKWDEARFRAFIHPEAVAIVPTTPGRLEGQDAYVAGWRAFCETAVIHTWRESDLGISRKRNREVAGSCRPVLS